MGKVQHRRTVSMAPGVYARAKAQAERLGIPVARWVTEAIVGALDPDLEAAEVVAEAGEEIQPGDPVIVGPDGRAWRTG